MVLRTKNLLRPALHEMSSYHVQPSQGLIKLDAMENPFQLPDEIQKLWLEMLAGVSLNRYPDAAAEELKQLIKVTLELPRQSELLLGNGSDELIQLLCLSVLEAPARKTGRPIIMAPEPGFVMYRHTAIATGLEYVGVPLLDDSFALDMPAMLNALEQRQPEVLYLAYPNNPTGNLFDWSDCLQLIKTAPGLVVFDEAYHPFAETSAAKTLLEYDHVLLLRTFSKLGLAGIRLGVLAGSPHWLQHLDKLRLPYNINVLTQVTAKFACQHYDLFLQQSAQIRKQRAWLYKELNKLPQISVFESRANFILFRLQSGLAEAVFNALIDSGVLIKNMDKSHAMLRGCLRVTVGTADENRKFLAALKQSI